MNDLVVKLAKIMSDCVIPKTGYNSFHKYYYRTHEDIVNKLRPALAKEGLVLFATEKKLLSNSPGHVIIEVRYTVSDGKDFIHFIGLGEGIDISREGKPGDKAMYKAQTGALKYALNDLFLIASSDDPENDENEIKEILSMTRKMGYNDASVKKRIAELGAAECLEKVTKEFNKYLDNTAKKEEGK